MTNKKCPKCGSNSFALESKVTAYLLYEVTNGHVKSNGIDADAGDSLSDTCICDNCGYRWHPKKLNDDFVIDE